MLTSWTSSHRDRFYIMSQFLSVPISSHEPVPIETHIMPWTSIFIEIYGNSWTSSKRNWQYVTTQFPLRLLYVINQFLLRPILCHEPVLSETNAVSWISSQWDTLCHEPVLIETYMSWTSSNWGLCCFMNQLSLRLRCIINKLSLRPVLRHELSLVETNITSWTTS
jgi:hypothetical protein